MAGTHDAGFRPYLASDFEAVAALWTRVNRELAPAGLGGPVGFALIMTKRALAFADYSVDATCL
jgi:hypothetical protein